MLENSVAEVTWRLNIELAAAVGRVHCLVLATLSFRTHRPTQLDVQHDKVAWICSTKAGRLLGKIQRFAEASPGTSGEGRSGIIKTP